MFFIKTVISLTNNLKTNIMKVIRILNHRLDFVKTIYNVNVIKVGYFLTELEFTQELENVLLLHDVGIYN